MTEILKFLKFTQWFPEVRHFCQDIPVILIGCKTDLRKDKECARKLKAMNQAPITYTQVRQDDTCRHLQVYDSFSAITIVAQMYVFL